MPFSYFDSLSAKNKRIYLASNRVKELPLPSNALGALAVKVRRLRSALGAASQRGTEGASREITRAVCEAVGVPIPHVRVHEVRPQGDYGELHGLYTRWDDGRARIEVWMRTAVNEQPVAFRTFLRTLAHELVHHLDYSHLALDDSFHTEGFFQRESSLAKQLLGASPPPAPRRTAADPPPPPNETRAEKLKRLRKRLGMREPQASHTAPHVTASRAELGPAPASDLAALDLDVTGTDVGAPSTEQEVARPERAPRARRARPPDTQLALGFDTPPPRES